MAAADATLSLTPEMSPKERLQAILAGFKGDIAPVTSSLSYRLGIALVTVVMVLLPLLYLGLIALVCYGVYYHIVNHVGMLGAVRGRGAAVMFALYVAPMVVGAILIVFMFKPIFSRPPKGPKTRKLERGEEPVLFAFVEKLCDTVGSPRPRRIEVDCQVNASASFRRGLWSMFGNDLVLTVGAPLVAGLTLRQFGGVLAHEFGHFAQGVGMRLTYVIRSISFWFTRVVYERDSWDVWLAQTAQGTDLRIGWMLYLAQFFVWLTRKVLWCLMIVGHGVAGFMLREMEFDADRHETRLAGSDTFESTARRLMLLNFAYHGAQSDLGRFYQEGRLADDLPRLVMANVDQLPPEALKAADEAVDKSETGWFDTHPCDRERIASAHRENTKGVFRIQAPATLLFRDFPEVAREATLNFYRNIFGPSFSEEAVHPVDDLLAFQGRELDSYKALDRCFQRSFSAWRPVRLARWSLEAPADPKQALAGLKAARESLPAGQPQYQEWYKRFDEADTKLLHAEQGTALLQARVRPAKQDFPVSLTTEAQVIAHRRAGREEREQIETDLSWYETLAASRLLAALDFLRHPAVAGRLAEAEDRRRECDRLLQVLTVLEGQVAPLVELRNALASLGILLSKWEGNEQNERLGDRIREGMTSLHGQVSAIRHLLKATDYPFDHARKDISVGAYVIAEMPQEEDLGGILDAADALVRTLPHLRARIVGRLCQVAEEVEKVLGLEPLPEPLKEEQKGGAEEA